MKQAFTSVLMAAAMVFGAASLHAEEHGLMLMQPEHFEKCAQACADCALMCASCTAHCSASLEKGEKEHFATLKSCEDCADFCSVTAKIVARGGPYAFVACEACHEICKQCAKKCEAFPDDHHMKMCAEQCRKCAEACKEMLKHK